MKEEAGPFIQQYHLEEQIPSPFAPMPMVCYRGLVHGMEVCLVWTGRDERYKVNNVATTAASVACYAAVVHYRPDLVLSAGTAGGFAAVGGRVGDVYLSTKCVFHSRRIPAGRNYEEYGFGHFRSPPLPKLAAKLALKQGVVSTSDCLDFASVDMEMMRSEGTAVKEMEAAAVAWVSQQLNVPFLALKSVTDIVDGPETVGDEFYANLAAASQALQVSLGDLLASLKGTTLQSWSDGHYNSSAFSNSSNSSSTRTETGAVHMASVKEPPSRTAMKHNSPSYWPKPLISLVVAGVATTTAWVLASAARTKRVAKSD